jgi:hypothetical protein
MHFCFSCESISIFLFLGRRYDGDNGRLTKMGKMRTRLRHDLITNPLSLQVIAKRLERGCIPLTSETHVFCHIFLPSDKNIGYRHGGVDTPQSKQITQNASQQLTITPIQ